MENTMRKILGIAGPTGVGKSRLGMTLAEKMGTAQANISRFENGNSNPSLEFLQKMAACMGKTLHVSFE